MKDKFNEELFNFINDATCSFTCIDRIKKELIKNNYIELYENEKWNFKTGKYFVIRNDASIIAFSIGKKHNNSFNIVCTHSDTPGFSLKPKGEIYENNYLKLNVFPYGGILNYGWMDRPLSISGRIVYKKENKYQKRIVKLDKPVCVIASEAIHQNDTANSDLDLNTQIDLIPIISLKEEKEAIKTIIKNTMNLDEDTEICDYDLFLHNNDKPMFIGINNDMILSPRLDDLTCTFANFNSFIQSDNEDKINVMCIVNLTRLKSCASNIAIRIFSI